MESRGATRSTTVDDAPRSMAAMRSCKCLIVRLLGEQLAVDRQRLFGKPLLQVQLGHRLGDEGRRSLGLGFLFGLGGGVGLGDDVDLA